MDAVEELRKAIVGGDFDRAKTLVGPVWHEREGLRRLAYAEARPSPAEPATTEPPAEGPSS